MREAILQVLPYAWALMTANALWLTVHCVKKGTKDQAAWSGVILGASLAMAFVTWVWG